MQPKFNQIYRSLFNNISSFKSCSQPSRTSSSLQAAASCAPDVTHGRHLQTHNRQQKKLDLKISETIYRLKIFCDHLTMDDYGWASSLGADFNEFWERSGGDYKIDYHKCLSHFDDNQNKILISNDVLLNSDSERDCGGVGEDVGPGGRLPATAGEAPDPA